MAALGGALPCRLRPSRADLAPASSRLVHQSKFLRLRRDKTGTASLHSFELPQSKLLAVAGLPNSRSRTSVQASAGTSAGIPSLSVALEGVTVFRADGASVPVLSLWEDRKAVVAFVRHYGCLLCRRRAGALADKKAEFDAAGVALAVIAPASIEQAATFLEQTNFPGEVYADPNHRSFEALEFAFGPGTVLNAKAGLNLIEARMQGFKQDWGLSFKEDTVKRGGWQQGGVLVAGPGVDNLLFLHKDKEAGDEPNMQQVLKACCGLPTPA